MLLDSPSTAAASRSTRASSSCFRSGGESAARDATKPSLTCFGPADALRSQEPSRLRKSRRRRARVAGPRQVAESSLTGSVHTSGAASAASRSCSPSGVVSAERPWRAMRCSSACPRWAVIPEPAGSHRPHARLVAASPSLPAVHCERIEKGVGRRMGTLSRSAERTRDGREENKGRQV